MCRFAMYLGPTIGLDALLTRPMNSIIHQSFENEEREEPLNGDGFGVAWYAPRRSPEPAVFRSISPAWSNQNLLHLARVTESEVVLAHVRAASPGLPVTETNCHPFTSGRWAFMHNGEVGGFKRIKRRILQELSEPSFGALTGTTDSEHFFAMFLDHVRPLTSPGEDVSVGAIAHALRQAIARVGELQREAGDQEPSYLNVCVTDGASAVACRYTSSGRPDDAESLYFHTGKRYVCDEHVCRMIEPDVDGHAVLVCSERLSDDYGWDPVPANHLVLVDRKHHTTLEPVVG